MWRLPVVGCEGGGAAEYVLGAVEDACRHERRRYEDAVGIPCVAHGLCTCVGRLATLGLLHCRHE